MAGEEGRQEGGKAHQGKGPSEDTLEKHKRAEHGNTIRVYGPANFIDIGRTRRYAGFLLAPEKAFGQKLQKKNL